MTTAMVIEDSPSDMHKALEVLAALGIEETLLFTQVDRALLYLQEVIDGIRPAPDVTILDLSLGVESGFEVLRLWRSNQQLQSMRIVVWTGMGELQKELCRLFGVKVVPKSAGLRELKSNIKATVA